MSYIQRLPEDYVQTHLKNESDELESSIRSRLKKTHAFLFSDTIPETENRPFIAYLAVAGKINWSDHYRGTSLEDVRFYDHFAREQFPQAQ